MPFDIRFDHPANIMVAGPSQVSFKNVLLNNFEAFCKKLGEIPCSVIYNFFFILVREIYMDQETSSIEREDFQKSAEKSFLYIHDEKWICRRII